MAYSHVSTTGNNTQDPPIVGELQAIFNELPDEELLTRLKGPRRRGRPGYEPVILWRCYVAYYVLGLASVSDLVRTLHDNPYIADVCGVHTREGIPSQPTFSRFISKLAKQKYKGLVNQVMHGLTRRLWETLPDFAKSVAVDATDLKAWSHSGKKTPTDKDAGWVVKSDTAGKKKFVWGFKLTLLVDTTHELPVALKVTKGNTPEQKAFSTVLAQARWINHKFHPEYVIADKGYSSEALRRIVRRQYRAQPIIKTNLGHKRALRLYKETAEWQLIYNRRSAIERVFSRLKGHRKLNSIRVRGIWKVYIHCLMSVIAMEAQAVATGSCALMRKVA